MLAPRKSLRVLGAQGPPLVVYSDAFFCPYSEPLPADGIRCRLGWVIFDPLSEFPVGGTMVIPESILAKWVSRDQQIFVAEALAPLAATILHHSTFLHRDVIWFIDNVGACSVLIKGNSSQYDAGIVAATCLLAWARMGVRMWFEWVASDDNPSDGLSRDGLLDQWTLDQRPRWQCDEHDPPAWFPLLSLPSVRLGDALMSLPHVHLGKPNFCLF